MGICFTIFNMKKLLGILVLGLLWCNVALAATDIVDVGINLYLILAIVGSAGVLCKLAGPVPGIIMTIIMWAVIFSNN